MRMLIPMVLVMMLLPTGAAFGQIKLPGVRTPAPESASDVVTVTVTANTDRLDPDSTFHLAVVIDIAPHWHVYWVDPGEAGAATELTVTAPAGFTVGPVKYPRPRAFRETDGTTYGYEGKTVLFVPVRTPATIPAAAEFKVETFYLVCREICLMGRASGTVVMPGSRPAADAKTLARYMQQVPRPLAERSDLRAQLVDDLLVIEGSAEMDLQFFPISVPGVTIGTTSITRQDGRFRLTAPVEIKPHNAQGQPMAVRGVLAFGAKPDDPSYEIRLPVTGSP